MIRQCEHEKTIRNTIEATSIHVEVSLSVSWVRRGCFLEGSLEGTFLRVAYMLRLVLRVLSGYFGASLGLLWGYFGATLGLLWGCFEGTIWATLGYIGATLGLL